VLGKPVSFELKKMDVQKILRNVCTLMQSQANMENVAINFQAMNHDLYIMCSEEQIKQVLLNIIKNGIEAIKGGGSITVEAAKDAGYAVIKITDNGAGISDNIKKRLGEPFYSTKEKGTGLGLMVCYNIVNQHGGHIDFFSEEGKGTTFQIRLPLIKDESQ
jgi:two-component system sporulation sensor kinase A